MTVAERPILRITERDAATGEAVAGVLDTSHLSAETIANIDHLRCRRCTANFENTVFTTAGRENPPPFSCMNMLRGNRRPKVNLIPLGEGEEADSNLKEFLSVAACKPIPGTSGVSNTPSSRGYDAF